MYIHMKFPIDNCKFSEAGMVDKNYKWKADTVSIPVTNLKQLHAVVNRIRIWFFNKY